LDRSGSMIGEKIVFAKEAIVKVIESLNEEDCIHFVVYDDKADVVFKDGNLSEKATLTEKVHNILAKGGTNLSGGIYKGFQLLKKMQRKHAVQRIFLFSDGRANCGISTTQGIFKIVDSFVAEGVTVSTFGLGDDFDEDTMRGIAERGSGDYYFIESPTHIVSCVQKAFQGLVGLVGTNGCFKVFAEPNCEVKEIFGPENPDTGYLFGDINSVGVRNVLVDMEVTPAAESEECKVLKWMLTYNSTTIPVVQETLSGELIMPSTSDHDLLDDVDDEVVLAVKVKQFGKKDKACKLLLDQNNIKGAITLKKEILSELRELSHRDKSGKIQKLIEFSERALGCLTEEEKIHLQPPPAREPVMVITNPGGLPTIFEKSLSGVQDPIWLRPKKAFSKKTARKYFDSGDYVCRNDNSHNWDSYDS